MHCILHYKLNWRSVFLSKISKIEPLALPKIKLEINNEILLFYAHKKWPNFLCIFQYCEESPLELPTCSFEDEGPSYTSLQYYDKWTREKMLLKDDIRCLCPEKYNYLDTRYKFMAKGHYDIVVTNYYCLPVSFSFCESHFWLELKNEVSTFHFMPSSFTHLRHKTLFHFVKALTSVLRHFFRENSSL